MKMGRIIELAWFVIITIVLCLAFLVLRSNQQKIFTEINANYENKLTVNLSADFNTRTLANLLVEGNYVTDDTSAVFIAGHIKTRLSEGTKLPNLGELNKRSFRISADSIDLKGGSYLKNRVENSRKSLGVTDSLPATAENIPDFKQGGYDIKIKVQEFDSTANFILKKLDKNRKAVPHVLVQIKEHYYDSLDIAQEFVLGYAKTDINGIAVVKGLRAEGYYSILPIQKGFEYGNPKGTVKGNLGSMKAKDRVITFTQREHQITLFDRYTYNGLKEDYAVTVRTPQEYQGKLLLNLILILSAWWVLHFYLVRRKKKTDPFLLPLLMFLSGVCLLTIYSIHNPLNDRMPGNDMAQGILVGIILAGVFSEIDFVKFFNGDYRFSGKRGGKIHFDTIRLLVIWISGIFGTKIKNRISKLPEGSGYLILAFLLTLLLFPFGTGPEGSGVKVNLFFFQPGEIVKYLIIVFLAAFFYHNDEKIRFFSSNFSIAGLGIQFRTILAVVLSLGALLSIYLVLGDMGPALVIAGTFIVIYSFIRKDLPELCIGFISFVLLLQITSWLAPHSQWVLFAATVTWLLLWLVYGFTINRKKQFFESAVFLNIVIAAFIFGSHLPYVGERLQDRNDMYTAVWDNEVRGGDQVAQGLWGLASGGIFGQGLGEGNSNLVPAFHTDMIFTSIGEETGWLGLFVIVFCMAMLLYRSLLAGKRAGHPFAFYLAAGIVIITGVQFLIITLGSTGIIPLTGVAVPFLSYGKVGMIMNMMAFGIVFSISGIVATDNQKRETDKYALMFSACKYVYLGFALVLLGTLFYYQFWERNETLIRPALTSSVTQRARIVEYNPRIRFLTKELYAGNIYDRNGILLAATNKEEIENSLSAYDEAGVAGEIYKKELRQRKRRYYPFGENLFFWLGDFNNTSVAWNDSENDPYGYIAERRHLADLRGFDNLKRDKNGEIQQRILTTKEYKGSNFLDSRPYAEPYTDYDYSFLIPYLKAGIHSRKLERFNEKREERDITLTVDAALQTKMQNEMAAYAAGNFKGERWNKLRISVVVLNAKEGDLLCSANYPLPDIPTLKLKQEEQERTKKFAYNEKDRKEKAYTDRDLGLTYQTPPGSTAKIMSALAGLQKSGTLANKTYYIDAREIVETGIEPHKYNVTMEDAIVKSSNNYFINLVNDQKLYENLDSIYQTIGIRIDRKYTRDPRENNALTPYFFTQNMAEEQKSNYRQEVNAVKNNGIRRYENYIKKRNQYKDSVPPYFEKMNWFETAWAWGQGSVSATPLNMARIVSIVANGGDFTETQFIKKGNETLKVEKSQITRIVSKNGADTLKGYMQKESDKHRRSGYAFPGSEKEENRMGGKTGTPEREMYYWVPSNRIDKKTGMPEMRKINYDVDNNKDGKMNDGWYVFFIDSPKEKAPLAVAIRMERLGTGISGNAVRFADEVVLKVLGNTEYLNE